MPYHNREKIVMLGLVISSCLGSDQTTKRIAEQTLGNTPHSFFFDTIRLHYIKNSGAFLGFGSHFSNGLKFWLFLVMPIVFLIGALLFLLFSQKTYESQRIMLALIVSGGIGNCIDRLLLSGQVTDFINVGIGALRTGIFNVADMAIMAGTIGLLAIEIHHMRSHSHK